MAGQRLIHWNTLEGRPVRPFTRRTRERQENVDVDHHGGESLMPVWAIVLIAIVVVLLLAVGGLGVSMSIKDDNADARRAKEAERRREWDRCSRRGPQCQASLRCRGMQPWLRSANNLPPVHDERQYHD